MAKHNRKSSRRRKPNRTHDFSRLEPRNLLAGIGFDSATGIVTITGSPEADSVQVVQSSTTEISVVYSNLETRSFGSASVNEVVFYGGSGNDWFKNGTSIPSKAFGHGGDDIIVGGTGNDRLRGGGGADRIYGNSGDDFLTGDGGDDFINGQSGNDSIYGHDGLDRLFGDSGVDLIVGGSSSDHMVGGLGNDTMFGNEGNDSLFGQAGDDWMSGGSDSDSMFGESGRDRVKGDSGDDYLQGGDDDDNLSGNDGDDRVFGHSGNDRITGDDGNDYLNGGSGNDRESGGWGDDTVLGESGDDSLYGDSGRDRIFGHLGNDGLFGGFDDDSLFGNEGDDLIMGGSGDDALFGHQHSDRMYGESGHDKMYAGSGDDLLRGGSGFDSLYGQQGSDDLDGQDDNDDLYGGSEHDRLRGGQGNDDYYGESGDDLFDDSDDYSSNGDFEIRGEISNFDAGAKTFTMLGITVDYSQSRVEGTIADGQFFKAEGSYDGNVLVAHEVEFENDDNRNENFEARGDISNLNTTARTFDFFGFTVNYSSARTEGTLANGKFVEVEGRLTNSTIVADKVEIEDRGTGGDDGSDDNGGDHQDGSIELRGNISNLDQSAKTFTMLGFTVHYSTAQIQGQLVNGGFFKTDGLYDGTRIVAREVETENIDDRDENFEATGTISNLDTTSKTFDLFGFSVDYSSAEIRTSLTEGGVVDVEGWFENNSIDADRIR